MTSLLETIQSGRQAKPPRVLLYGVEGIGKSTFGSQAPKPIFIQTEDGLDELECDRFPLATTFDDVIAALKSNDSECCQGSSCDGETQRRRTPLTIRRSVRRGDQRVEQRLAD